MDFGHAFKEEVFESQVPEMVGFSECIQMV